VAPSGVITAKRPWSANSANVTGRSEITLPMLRRFVGLEASVVGIADPVITLGAEANVVPADDPVMILGADPVTTLGAVEKAAVCITVEAGVALILCPTVALADPMTLAPCADAMVVAGAVDTLCPVVVMPVERPARLENCGA